MCFKIAYLHIYWSAGVWLGSELVGFGFGFGSGE